MSWPIERNNKVLSAEHIKLRLIVTAMSVQNQELISTGCMRLGVLIEYFFKPDQSQLVVCLFILTDFNSPVVQQLILKS